MLVGSGVNPAAEGRGKQRANGHAIRYISDTGTKRGARGLHEARRCFIAHPARFAPMCQQPCVQRNVWTRTNVDNWIPFFIQELRTGLGVLFAFVWGAECDDEHMNWGNDTDTGRERDVWRSERAKKQVPKETHVHRPSEWVWETKQNWNLERERR